MNSPTPVPPPLAVVVYPPSLAPSTFLPMYSIYLCVQKPKLTTHIYTHTFDLWANLLDCVNGFSSVSGIIRGSFSRIEYVHPCIPQLRVCVCMSV